MSDILFAAADGVATITLNRPDVLNSFTRSMARELHDALTCGAEIKAYLFIPDILECISTGVTRRSPTHSVS